MSVEAPLRTKRPWYLPVALFISLMFGTCGWMDAYGSMRFYQDTEIDTPPWVKDLEEGHEKEAAKTASIAWLEARNAERARGLPLSVAAFVLGGAIVIMTMRTFARRGTAKKLLIQLLVAQALVLVLTFFATPAVRARGPEAHVAQQRAIALASSKSDAERAQVLEIMALLGKTLPAAQAIQLALRTVLCSLVLFALTRPSVKSYEEAMAADS